MTPDEAKVECERWLTNCDERRRKSREMQQLAADRRAGRCDAEEAAVRLKNIHFAAPLVYDGANLEEAVRVLLGASE